jgi:hypothetical protein
LTVKKVVLSRLRFFGFSEFIKALRDELSIPISYKIKNPSTVLKLAIKPLISEPNVSMKDL